MEELSAPLVGELPAEVRTRVTALVAESLPALSPVPPSLRKVAEFTPSRRARAGGAVIVGALADDEFRARAGTQVRAMLPDLAAATDAGEMPSEADPLDVAALVWLSRPPGWEKLLATVVERLAAERAGPDDREVERLHSRVAAGEQALREARTEHRAQLDELRDEHTMLRRRLGEARAATREANAALEAAVRDRDEARALAERAESRSDKELRRLRAQVDQLSQELQTARRESRSQRDEAGIRARLLLETLLGAATGLRRELALAPVTGTPADSVDAEIAEEGVRDTSAVGALGPGSAALLEHLLAMPRARLVVDGYNVSKTAWPTASLEAQRTRLVGALAPVVARTGAETTVVFDAHATSSRPVVSAPRGVRVVFSPEGVIADDVIREYVAAEPTGRVVVVVTSDQALAADVRADGARVVWSAALIALIG